MLQHALYRLQVPPKNKDSSWRSEAPREFFEDQYLVFYEPRKAQDHELDRERATFRKNLLWNYVNTHFNPKESREYERRLKE